MWPSISVRLLQDPEVIHSFWGISIESWAVIAQLFSAFAIIAAAFAAAFLSGRKDRVKTKHKKYYLVAILETFNLALVTLAEKAETEKVPNLEISRMAFIKAGNILLKTIDTDDQYFITAWQPDLFYALKALSVTFTSVSEKSNGFIITNFSQDGRAKYIKLITGLAPLLSDIIKIQRKFAKPWPVNVVLLWFERSQFKMEKNPKI